MMHSLKTLLKLALIACLVLFVNIAGAQTYTSVPVEYVNGWSLKFQDATELEFKKSAGKIILQWKGVKHPWLYTKPHEVEADNFAALNTLNFDSYSKKNYSPILKAWQKRKKEYSGREKIRYAKEKESYDIEIESAKLKLVEDLAEWKLRKKVFDEKENARYQSELKIAEKEVENDHAEWESEKAEFDQEAKTDYLEDKAEYDEKLSDYKKEKREECDLKTFGCPDRPDMPYPKKYPEAEPKTKNVVPSAPFSEPEPHFLKPSPPIQPSDFTELKPDVNLNPAYQVTGLALHLSRNSCPTGKFRLETNPGKIYFVSSRAEKINSSSPWSESSVLIRCLVSTKSGRSLLRLTIDKDRLVALLLDQPIAEIKLVRVISPALRKFDKEMSKRDMYLKKLDFSKESVEASYWNKVERTALDVVYEMAGKKKNLLKVSSTLPVFLYDPMEKNLDRLITRVNLFQVRKLGDKKVLQLRRLYTHKVKGNPKKWIVKADVNHAIVKGQVNNLIKMQSRTGDSLEKIEIGSGGFVTDFSALLQLVSWYTNQKTQTIPLAYFDDTRVYVMKLKRLQQDRHSFQGEQIDIQKWEVKNVDGGSFMRLSVGMKDQIVYRLELPDRKLRFDLKSIGTERIRKNQEWAEEFKQKHQLVPVTGL